MEDTMELPDSLKANVSSFIQVYLQLGSFLKKHFGNHWRIMSINLKSVVLMQVWEIKPLLTIGILSIQT